MARKKRSDSVEIVTIEIDGNMIEVKKCTKCGEVKALSEYNNDKKSVGGKNAACRVCRKATCSKWVANNRESVREYMKVYVEESKEHRRAYLQKYKEEKRDKYTASQRKYRANNKDKAVATKHRRRARKAALPDTLTAEQVAILLSQGCALTGVKDDIHLDHFIPLAWGYGGTTIENMISLEATLNLSKNDKNPFEWIKTRSDIEAWRWQELVEDLAELNDMTPKEYEDYIYECEANKRDLTIEGA